MWRPKLFEVLPTYDRRTSGVTPQAGIYTAVVGGFLARLAAGDRSPARTPRWRGRGGERQLATFELDKGGHEFP